MLRHGAGHKQDEGVNLRCQAGGNESKEQSTVQMPPEGVRCGTQSTLSTTAASSSSTLAATAATRSSEEGYDRVAEGVGIDAAGEIIMTINIVGTEVINDVLYYRLHTPLRHDMVSSVLRRYNEFVKLDNALAASRCSRRVVPVNRGFHPGAEMLGLRRSLTGDRFLQRRQDMLQQYLDVIVAQWPVGSQDSHVQEFLHLGASHEAPTPSLMEEALEKDLRQKARGDALAWLVLRAQLWML